MLLVEQNSHQVLLKFEWAQTWSDFMTVHGIDGQRQVTVHTLILVWHASYENFACMIGMNQEKWLLSKQG